MNYRTLYRICSAVLRLWHPVFRVSGKENVPAGGNVVICANHSGMADPFWVLLAVDLGKLPRIMAKAQLMKIPLLNRILRALNVFGVRRGENDIAAIKMSLSALKSGESLLLFPEGTRVRKWKTITPKSGAVMLAARTKTPILPVFLEPKRFPFSPMRCVIGKPYLPQGKGEKPTAEELHRMAGELMKKIYALGETT